MTERNLAGQAILVTGAARGIGAQTARQLAARGARLSLVGLEPDRLAEVAEQCGPEAMWVEADITDTEAIEAAARETVKRLGAIDALVANAGIAPFGTVRTIDSAAFERTIEVNLLGTWRTVRACLEPIIDRRGYILVVASLAAAGHNPGLAPYSASKAGVEAFSNSLRWELADLGVDVGVAYFSWLSTDMVSVSEEQHPGFTHLRDSLPGPASKVYPVEAAAEAIVRGIERRSEHVVVPGWARAMLALRGFLPALTRRELRKIGPEVAQLCDQQVAERGAREASVPDRSDSAAAFKG